MKDLNCDRSIVRPLTFIIAIFFFISNEAIAQKPYTVSGSELIFGMADIELTDEYKSVYPQAKISDTPLRFTAFFHINEYVHIDFGNVFGIFSGGALRNVGFVTNEVLPSIIAPASSEDYQKYKVIRRLYTLGVPFALKLGSLKDDIFFFKGGEVELAIHMKEKYWKKHSRSGGKTKKGKWFPDNAETLIPSVFAGFQFKNGTNLKFRYYLSDFINLDYDGDGTAIDISNLQRYEAPQVLQFSLSTQIRTEDRKKKEKKSDDESKISFYN